MDYILIFMNPKKKFSKIYNQYVHKIYRFVFLKVSSQETAEDLTAQVFTNGWDKFRQDYNKIENVPAYLYQIARTEIANFYRKESRIKTISEESISIIDPNPSPEQNFSNQSDLKMLQNHLKQLNEDYQNIIIWRYLDDLSFKQIAQIMKKPEGTVRVMNYRALKELREKMEIKL